MKTVSDCDALPTGRIRLLYLLFSSFSSYSRFACSREPDDDVINVDHVTTTTASADTRQYIALIVRISYVLPVTCLIDGKVTRRVELYPWTNVDGR